MKSGRRPKPTKTKQLAGNPGRRPLNTAEPKLTGVPMCPEWLEDDAKAMWNQVVPQLVRNGVAFAPDTAVIAGYCQSWARWMQAEAVIRSEGITTMGPQGIKKHPAVTVASEAKREMRAFAASLGLDPTSRSRIHAVPDEPEDEDAKFFGDEAQETKVQ